LGGYPVSVKEFQILILISSINYKSFGISTKNALAGRVAETLA
jgi:hypothetical protein